MTTTQLMTPARPGLADLLDGIREQTRRGLDPRRTALAVADVLRAQMPGSDLLTEEERQGDDTELVSHVLHAEAGFSIKALVWKPGQLTSIHDHIAWCAFGVIQGVEYETLYRDHGDHLTEIGRVANRVGDASGFAPPGDIHRVHNTGDVTAISLHVYGADLSADGVTVRREYDLPVRDHQRSPWHDSAALAALGRSVADDGLSYHLAEMESLALAAASISPAAAQVLADADAPEVARLRAFAVVSAALSQSS